MNNNIKNYFKSTESEIVSSTVEECTEDSVLIESPTKIQQRQDELIIKNMEEVLSSVEKRRHRRKPNCSKRKKRLLEEINEEVSQEQLKQKTENESRPQTPLELVTSDENLNNNNQNSNLNDTPTTRKNAFLLLMSSSRPKESCESVEDSGKKKRKYTKKIKHQVPNIAENPPQNGTDVINTSCPNLIDSPSTNGGDIVNDVMPKKRVGRSRSKRIASSDSIEENKKETTKKRKISSVQTEKKTKGQKVVAIDTTVEKTPEKNPEIADVTDTPTWHSGRPKRSCTSKILNYDFLVSPEKLEKSISPPKKEKAVKTKKTGADSSVEIIDILTPEKSMSKQSKKQNSKLAPLFVKQAPKPAVDPKILEARRNFLFSGLPETLRQEIDKQKKFEDTILGNELIAFPLISHITQFHSDDDKTGDLLTQSKIKIVSDKNELIVFNVGELKYGQFSKCDGVMSSAKTGKSVVPKKKKIGNMKEIVGKFKEDWEEFPVNRCFKQLMKKSMDPSKMEKNDVNKNKKKKSRSSLDSSLDISMEQETFSNIKNCLFVDKYRPRKLEEYLVNHKPTKELYNFFVAFSEKASSSEYDSEYENSLNWGSRFNNCVVLIGPIGCGKTSSVYATANNLNLKVIEINAGSKRNGKKIIQDLQEATQSHRIKKKNFNNDDNCTASQDIDQDDEKTIILIEDADLLFEDLDDGFIPAIQQLVNISKRPVVLTANENCQHLAKFMQQNSIIFDCPNTKYIAKWLTILCLVENQQINLTDIESLYEFNNRDLRKTINAIEFFTKSHHQQQQQYNQQHSIVDNLFNFYYKMNYNWQQQLQYKWENCNRIFNWRLNLNGKTDIKDCSFVGELTSSVISFRRSKCYEESDGTINDVGLEIQEYLMEKSGVDLIKENFVENNLSTISSTLYIQPTGRPSALDYDPLMREICRYENQRLEKERRASRFYHYLRNCCVETRSTFSNEIFNEHSKIFQ